MTDKVTRLELLRVLSSDASDYARERCATIHHTTDIRASGDEVEVTVRQMIREKARQATTSVTATSLMRPSLQVRNLT